MMSSDDVRGLAELGAGRPVAIVTGAARRVGRATAKALARAGCDVIVTFRSGKADAEDVCAEIRRLGVRAAAMELDIGDLGDRGVGAWSREVNRALPRLDVLVHNASSYDAIGLEKLTAEDVLSAYRVNAAGPLMLTQGLLPLLGRSTMKGGGAVVAMADIHALGEHGLPRRKDYVAYAMSKAALVEMVRTLARELAPRVRVNAVALGVAAWPEAGDETDAAMQAAYLKNVPLGRAGSPEEAAEAVRWLAMDATYVTGQVLRVDGGRSLV